MAILWWSRFMLPHWSRIFWPYMLQNWGDYWYCLELLFCRCMSFSPHILVSTTISTADWDTEHDHVVLIRSLFFPYYYSKLWAYDYFIKWWRNQNLSCRRQRCLVRGFGRDSTDVNGIWIQFPYQCQNSNQVPVTPSFLQ